MNHCLHVAAVTTFSTSTLIMDFSSFNAAEQAHMTKVIEKRQVSTPSHPILYFQLIFKINRCKTSSKCIPTSSKNASTLAVMTSQARLCHQKRSFFHPVSFDSMFILFFQEQCILNCTEKFIKHSERVGARFAEQNAGVYIKLI